LIRINPDIIPEAEFDPMEKLNEQIQQFINAHNTKPDLEMGGLWSNF